MPVVFPALMLAIKTGSHMVTEYYTMLMGSPELLYKNYTDVSTMVRSDGTASQTGRGLKQIRSLILTWKCTWIEVKAARFLDSPGGCILADISGFLRTAKNDGTRKFTQTFLLAPGELVGHYIFHDLLHLIPSEQIHQCPAAISHNNNESSVVVASELAEPVSDYMLREESQCRDFKDPAHVEESDTDQKQQRIDIILESQQVFEVDNRGVESHIEDTCAPSHSVVSVARDPPPATAEELAGEQIQQTYASVLAKAQAAPLSKQTSAASDWGQALQSAPQQSYHVGPIYSEAVEEGYVLEDEGEEKSVYIGEVPSVLSESDLEQEFKDFGRIKPDGVTIRRRNDLSTNYGFIDFEDVIGVRNALKASPLIVKGCQISVEAKRPVNNISKGGRRGRGRGGYQSEAPPPYGRGGYPARGLSLGGKGGPGRLGKFGKCGSFERGSYVGTGRKVVPKSKEVLLSLDPSDRLV